MMSRRRESLELRGLRNVVEAMRRQQERELAAREAFLRAGGFSGRKR